MPGVLYTGRNASRFLSFILYEVRDITYWCDEDESSFMFGIPSYDGSTEAIAE